MDADDGSRQGGHFDPVVVVLERGLRRCDRWDRRGCDVLARHESVSAIAEWRHAFCHESDIPHDPNGLLEETVTLPSPAQAKSARGMRVRREGRIELRDLVRHGLAGSHVNQVESAFHDLRGGRDVPAAAQERGLQEAGSGRILLRGDVHHLTAAVIYLTQWCGHQFGPLARQGIEDYKMDALAPQLSRVCDARQGLALNVVSQSRSAVGTVRLLQLMRFARGTAGEVVSPRVLVVPQDVLIALEEAGVLIRVVRAGSREGRQRLRRGQGRVIPAADGGGARSGGRPDGIVLARYISPVHGQVLRELADEVRVETGIRAADQPRVGPRLIPAPNGVRVGIDVGGVVACASFDGPAQYVVWVPLAFQGRKPIRQSRQIASAVAPATLIVAPEENPLAGRRLPPEHAGLPLAAEDCLLVPERGIPTSSPAIVEWQPGTEDADTRVSQYLRQAPDEPGHVIVFGGDQLEPVPARDSGGVVQGADERLVAAKLGCHVPEEGRQLDVAGLHERDHPGRSRFGRVLEVVVDGPRLFHDDPELRLVRIVPRTLCHIDHLVQPAVVLRHRMAHQVRVSHIVMRTLHHVHGPSPRLLPGESLLRERCASSFQNERQLGGSPFLTHEDLVLRLARGDFAEVAGQPCV